jgi:hypothetical protein
LRSGDPKAGDHPKIDDPNERRTIYHYMVRVTLRQGAYIRTGAAFDRLLKHNGGVLFKVFESFHLQIVVTELDCVGQRVPETREPTLV